MPSSNTSNFSETAVGLSRKTGDSPTSNDSFSTAAFGNGDAVDHLLGVEDGADREILFKQRASKIDFFGHTATIDLPPSNQNQ